jgi:hypothetical protein
MQQNAYSHFLRKPLKIDPYLFERFDSKLSQEHVVKPSCCGKLCTYN